MLDLASKKCVPCEGGVPPLEASEAHALTAKLQQGWSVSKDAKNLHRSYRFEDFYRTMSFVNAVAHIANTEDHHPDMVIGYNYCRITYSPHSIGGLSANDFICAAKIDRL